MAGYFICITATIMHKHVQHVHVKQQSKNVDVYIHADLAYTDYDSYYDSLCKTNWYVHILFTSETTCTVEVSYLNS